MLEMIPSLLTAMNLVPSKLEWIFHHYKIETIITFVAIVLFVILLLRYAKRAQEQQDKMNNELWELLNQAVKLKGQLVLQGSETMESSLLQIDEAYKTAKNEVYTKYARSEPLNLHVFKRLIKKLIGTDADEA